jgi:hypothetical protein
VTTATAIPAASTGSGPNTLADVKFEGGAMAVETGKPYMALLSESCPVESVTFGEVTFHKRVERRDKGDKVLSLRGLLLRLTDAQVEHCKQEIRARALRIFYERNADGQIVRRGQTDVAHHRWSRPGLGPDSKPFLGTDGKPLEKPEYVAMPGYRASNNDLPWTGFAILQPVSPENENLLRLLQGDEIAGEFLSTAPNLAEPAKDVLEATRAFNEAEATKEQTLASEVGISTRRGRRPPGGTMSRED